MYHILRKGDVVLSLINFKDQSLSQLILPHGNSFPLLIAHVVWTLESLDGCRYVAVFNK